MKFMDVFFLKSDLKKEEIDYYEKYHLNFIKQSSKFLTENNISIKDLEKIKMKNVINVIILIHLKNLNLKLYKIIKKMMIMIIEQ